MVDITRLEYFAGLAMQTMITHPYFSDGEGLTDFNVLADASFTLARAMQVQAMTHHNDGIALDLKIQVAGVDALKAKGEW